MSRPLKPKPITRAVILRKFRDSVRDCVLRHQVKRVKVLLSRLQTPDKMRTKSGYRALDKSVRMVVYVFGIVSINIFKGANTKPDKEINEYKAIIEYSDKTLKEGFDKSEMITAMIKDVIREL